MTPDTRDDANSGFESASAEPPAPSARDGASSNVLPDSYRAHHGPTPLAAATQHKTLETETVKIKDEEAEERRRVTVKLRKNELPQTKTVSEPDDIISPQDETTAPDHHALELQLALRRFTAPSRYWTLLGAGTGLVAIIVLVLVVRSLTGSRASGETTPVSTAVAPTAALIPSPPKLEATPTPAAQPEPVKVVDLRREAAAKVSPPAKPAEKLAALPKPAPASKPPTETSKSAPAPTSPPKASFPPEGKSSQSASSPDIRRDVPF